MAHEHLGSPNTVPSFVPRIPLTRFVADDTPTRVIEPSADIESRYVLVRSAEPVAAAECEELGVTAVEVTVLWGTNVLHVAHLSPARAFTIGHGDGAVVDFIVPEELARFAKTEIVSVREGAPRVVAPNGAELVTRSGRLDIIADDAQGGRSAALRDGDVAELRFGELAFRIASVTAGKRLPRQLGSDTAGLGGSFMATFAAVATLLGVIAYYTPALGSTLDDGMNPEQLAVMKAFLHTDAEPEQKAMPNDGDASGKKGGGTPGEAARGEPGKMGRPDKPSVQKKFAIAGTGPVELSHEQKLAEIKDFGMIGMLNTMNARSVPQALWGANVPNGPDAVDAWGELFGEDIGESGGQGGLTLSGPGMGGGGHGDQIGLGMIGTCGTDCGKGPGGWGVGVGNNGRKGHTPVGPQVRYGVSTVNGHLPAEVIQRIVRQNYGRFRSCYENGLRTNPNLTGRVTARFVISRDGSVANVSNGGSDLPDSGVVSCVLSAFYGLSFSAPDGGIVTVTYPIVLVPG
jgi:hypothetical protein